MSFIVFPCLCLYDSTGFRIPLTVHPKLARRSWVVTSSGCWWPPKSFVLGLWCQEGRNRQNIMMGLDGEWCWHTLKFGFDHATNTNHAHATTLWPRQEALSAQGADTAQSLNDLKSAPRCIDRNLLIFLEKYHWLCRNYKDMMSRQMHSDVLILPLVGLKIESLATVSVACEIWLFSCWTPCSSHTLVFWNLFV